MSEWREQNNYCSSTQAAQTSVKNKAKQWKNERRKNKQYGGVNQQ